MKTLLRFVPPFAVLPTIALAVYAPIPEQEQGKALTFRLGASLYHDSNIFGAATGEIDSPVFGLTGAISYNGSISDQTFASASYDISNDYVSERPGDDQNLTNQNFAARLAHAFSSVSNIDLSAAYNIVENPESLLSGVALNTDQSYKRGQFDGRFSTAAGQKTGLLAKYRFIDYAYDTPSLAFDLDRSENLIGLEASYAFLPETKLVGEYRYQDISYDVAGAFKDKTSHFLMAGADYNPGKDLMISGRLGFEDRTRDGAPDDTVPYVEFTSRYTYTEGSYFAAGYTYTLEEPSDPLRFTDAETNRFVLNLQHRLGSAITASGSLTYSPAVLQGRGLQADIDEDTTRFGLGLTWQPTKNWSVAGNYDMDHIDSEDPNRSQDRDRFGVSARYSF
jgi:predicted porin